MSVRSLILVTICLALGLVLTGTAGAGEQPRNAPARVSPQQLDAYTWISGCLDPKAEQMIAPKTDPDCGGILLSTADSSVVMNHLDAALNCCTDISIAVRLEDDTIRFREQETGDYCHCTCTYDLAAELNGLDPGPYQAEVWSAGGELLCAQSVEVPQTGPRLSYTSSGCLDPEPLKNDMIPDDKQETEETVEIFARGSNIHVQHHSAQLNCCTELVFDITEEEGVFRLYESEQGDECLCLCRFDITALILDVSPGTYLLNYTTPTVSSAAEPLQFQQPSPEPSPRVPTCLPGGGGKEGRLPNQVVE